MWRGSREATEIEKFFLVGFPTGDPIHCVASSQAGLTTSCYTWTTNQGISCWANTKNYTHTPRPIRPDHFNICLLQLRNRIQIGYCSIWGLGNDTHTSFVPKCLSKTAWPYIRILQLLLCCFCGEKKTCRAPRFKPKMLRILHTFSLFLLCEVL